MRYAHIPEVVPHRDALRVLRRGETAEGLRSEDPLGRLLGENRLRPCALAHGVQIGGGFGCCGSCAACRQKLWLWRRDP